MTTARAPLSAALSLAALGLAALASTLARADQGALTGVVDDGTPSSRSLD